MTCLKNSICARTSKCEENKNKHCERGLSIANEHCKTSAEQANRRVSSRTRNFQLEESQIIVYNNASAKLCRAPSFGLVLCRFFTSGDVRCGKDCSERPHHPRGIGISPNLRLSSRRWVPFFFLLSSALKLQGSEGGSEFAQRRACVCLCMHWLPLMRTLLLR